MIILGGGWAGLLAARELSVKSPSAKITVIEKSSYEKRGGLLRTEELGGHRFDIGGPHILFSRNRETLDNVTKILGRNVKRMYRRAYIYINGRFINYPFENGMYRLPRVNRAEIGKQVITNIVKNNTIGLERPSNFLEWIYSSFGTEMGDMYLRPYNQKIWKRDLSKMDSDWVYSPGRLPLPRLEEIIKAIAGLKEDGYKEQSYFYYPRNGGIQSLYDALLKEVSAIENIEVIFGEEIGRLTQTSIGWKVNSERECNILVNTLPLPSLLSMLGDKSVVDHDLISDFNRVVTVGLVLNVKTPKQLAVYVPQKDIIFHRYSWMSFLEPRGSDKGAAVLAEITVPKEKESLAPEEYIQRTIEGFFKIGVIRDNTQVIASNAWFNSYGYPIYALGHSEVRSSVLSDLERIKIYSVGRWGSWHYWNTDKVYDAVIDIVSRISI